MQREGVQRGRASEHGRERAGVQDIGRRGGGMERWKGKLKELGFKYLNKLRDDACGRARRPLRSWLSNVLDAVSKKDAPSSPCARLYQCPKSKQSGESNYQERNEKMGKSSSRNGVNTPTSVKSEAIEQRVT